MPDDAKKDENLPSLEELFVLSTSETLELAQLLGMNYKDFIDTMKMAWHVDRARRVEEDDKKAKEQKKENST